MKSSIVHAIFLCACISGVDAFTQGARLTRRRLIVNDRTSLAHIPRTLITPVCATTTEEDQDQKIQDADQVQQTDESDLKYGLEGGVFNAVRGGNLPKAKELLQKYGAAYLTTSITLALISFGTCYVLVDNGVDVTALLTKVGIEVDTGSMAETAGTATIAYVIHKAASPIRFVPTVALTPVVAKWLGNSDDVQDL